MSVILTCRIKQYFYENDISSMNYHTKNGLY